MGSYLVPRRVFVSEKECREIRQGASRRKPSISRCGLIAHIESEAEEKISLACSTRFRPGDNFRLNAKLSAPFILYTLCIDATSELAHLRSSYGLPARATPRCIIIHTLQFLRTGFFASACLFFSTTTSAAAAATTQPRLRAHQAHQAFLHDEQPNEEDEVLRLVVEAPVVALNQNLQVQEEPFLPPNDVAPIEGE
uniref:Uncharacterized protein n=1 Tax=Trichogramma kaykai TaxID=54128 RepID=A0ABD2WXR5_9HYME